MMVEHGKPGGIPTGNGTLPEVSVVIPAFNAADTLGEQLAALAGQRTDFAWEVLVCDNGSTDDTAAIADAWRDRLPGLRVIDASARRGPSAARNIGAAAARAPRLAFCDADDVVGAGWVTAMRAALDDDALVAGSLEGDLLNPDSTTTVSWTTSPVLIKPFLPQLRATSSNNLGVLAEVFHRLDGFEEGLRTAEDVDLCWRVELAGHPLAYRPEIVLHMRKRAGLRSIFRQTYSYGVGDKLLRRRYAAVIAELRDRPPAQHPDDDAVIEPAAPPRGGRIGRVLAKGPRRILADLLARAGFWCAERFGKYDPSIPAVRTDGTTEHTSAPTSRRS